MLKKIKMNIVISQKPTILTKHAPYKNAGTGTQRKYRTKDAYQSLTVFSKRSYLCTHPLVS